MHYIILIAFLLQVVYGLCRSFYLYGLAGGNLLNKSIKNFGDATSTFAKSAGDASFSMKNLGDALGGIEVNVSPHLDGDKCLIVSKRFLSNFKLGSDKFDGKGFAYIYPDDISGISGIECPDSIN